MGLTKGLAKVSGTYRCNMWSSQVSSANKDLSFLLMSPIEKWISDALAYSKKQEKEMLKYSSKK